MRGHRLHLRRMAFLLTLILAVSASSGVGAQSTKEISAKALTDHGCDSTEWHFVITQIDSPELAPASIDVEWANGDSETVPLDNVTGGVAHYATSSNLDSTVVSATATIYDDWDGQFNLSHGPCETPPTEVPPTEVPPTEVPPTEVQPTEVQPTEIPPTEVPPTEVPPTEVPPTETPVTQTPSVTPTQPATATATPTHTATATATATHPPTTTVTPQPTHPGVTPTATSPVGNLPVTGTDGPSSGGPAALVLLGAGILLVMAAALTRIRRSE